RPAHVAHLAAERGSILELHETPKPHALALSDIGAQIEPRDDAQPRATKPELAAFWRRSFEAGRDTDLTVVKPAFRARRHRQKHGTGERRHADASSQARTERNHRPARQQGTRQPNATRPWSRCACA